MIEIYFTDGENLHGKTLCILEKRLGFKPVVLTTPNGKPYIESNPLYFSLSHSGKYGVIALSEKPVGADIESLEKKRNFKLITKSFTERENAVISSIFPRFLENWTAKESYIKLLGKTLKDIKNLEFYDGFIYENGVKSCKVIPVPGLKKAVCSVCSESENDGIIIKTPPYIP